MCSSDLPNDLSPFMIVEGDISGLIAQLIAEEAASKNSQQVTSVVIPQTGDKNNMLLYLSLGLISITGIITLLVFKKHSTKN